MKPSTFDFFSRSSSRATTRTTRLLSVLSAAVLFTSTGCYTKLATNDGDHWGYTGPVRQKVVVRETDDTIVVRETRVIHQPQPVITDTVTYSNSSTGEENVVVNNYFAPPAQTFGMYDPWTNTYPTWYDDYWYRPGPTVVIAIGDPYYRPRWFDRHWRRHSYYQSWWDYNYYHPYDNWYHASYRGPGWAYYDPYYPYPPLYGYGYGCYAPIYDPYAYWPYYGYGGYYGYYGDHYGHGHHGYYGDNDNDDNGRDRDGRERRRGNVDGEERGRGGNANDNGGGSHTGVVVPDGNIDRVSRPGNDRVDAIPVNRNSSSDPLHVDAANGGSNASTRVNGTPQNANTGKRIGNVDISTGEVPTDGGSINTNTSGGRAVKSSPAQNAPDVYRGNPSSNVGTTYGGSGYGSSTTTTTPVERRAPAPVNIVKDNDATSGSRGATSYGSSSARTNTPEVSTPPARTTTPSNASTSTRTNSNSESAPAPRNSAPAQSPSYTPRSSGSVSNSGSSSSTSSSGSRPSSSSSSGSSSSRGSDSRGSDSRSNNDGGGRGRR